MNQVLILGLDGADPEWLRRGMALGDLPNLKALAESGMFSPLLSTNPPLTPQAWSSFACGVNPGKHGVFDFGEIPDHSYHSCLNTSEDRKTRGFWDYLSLAGMRCGIINMPLSHPAEEISAGYMIGGMHTPDLPSLTAHPEVRRLILEEFPDYSIDVMSYWYEDMRAFVRQVHQMETRRTDLALRLMQKFPTDLLFVTFVGIDRVCHAFMDQQEAYCGEFLDWKYQGVVRDIYRHIDTQVGRLLDASPDVELVMVLSDHGFGDLKKDVYLNSYLQTRGWLKFSPQKLHTAVMHHPNWNYGPLLSACLNLLLRIPAMQRMLPWQHKSEDTVDWGKTAAFSSGLFGNVYLNRTGRFPKGWLTYGSDEYTSIRRSVMDDLLSLRDQGQPVVDEIYLNEEIYQGPYVQKAPDLILKMRNYSYITRGGFEFRSNLRFDSPAIHHSGNHRMEGILLLYGKGVNQGSLIKPLPGLIDLVPTLMAWLGLQIPKDMDGQVLQGAFTQKLPDVRVPVNIYRDTVANEKQISEEVKERLRALGYMN